MPFRPKRGEVYTYRPDDPKSLKDWLADGYRKLLTVPNICSYRQICTSCELLKDSRGGRGRKGHESDSSDSSSSDSDNENSVHQSGTRKPGVTKISETEVRHDEGLKTLVSGHSPKLQQANDKKPFEPNGQQKRKQSKTGSRKKPLFTVDGTEEGDEIMRSQLDETILSAAKSVAEELKGDTTEIKSELVSKLKQQLDVTREQKMGKPPGPKKKSPEDMLQKMTETVLTDSDMREDLSRVVEQIEEEMDATEEKTVAKEEKMVKKMVASKEKMVPEEEKMVAKETEKTPGKEALAYPGKPRKSPALKILNLPEGVTYQELKRFFSPAENVRVVVSNYPDLYGLRYGLALFEKESIALEMFKLKQGEFLKGKQIFLTHELKTTDQGDKANVVIISNLPDDITEEELSKFISPAEDFRILWPKNKKDQFGHRYAVVYFDTALAAQTVLKSKQGTDLKGKKILLKLGPVIITALVENRTLIVKGLPATYTDVDIQTFFSPATVEKMAPKKSTWYVQFDSAETANEMMVKNGTTVSGAQIYIHRMGQMPMGRTAQERVKTDADQFESAEPWRRTGMEDRRQQTERSQAHRGTEERMDRARTSTVKQADIAYTPAEDETGFIKTGKFTGERLNIFSPEDMKSVPEIKGELRLFNTIAEELKRQKMAFPVSNAFEEQIQWTREGKLWKFPIDNEQGWEEEANVSFEEHVFLEDLLEDFPKKGPIRHFMELVTTALSKNPYLTVKQKREHIDWYKNYFEEKKAIIEESLIEAELEKVAS